MQRKREHSTAGKIKFNTNRNIRSERSAVDDLVVIFNIFQIDFAPTDDETNKILTRVVGPNIMRNMRVAKYDSLDLACSTLNIATIKK